MIYEDDAELFLKEHDPMYYKNNKRKKMEYSYLSPSQWKRHSVEIPESNLRTNQRISASAKKFQPEYGGFE